MCEPEFTPEHEARLTALLRRCGKYLYFHYSKPGMQQASVLRYLAEGPVSQKEIQARLGVQPGSASELISKLEAKGFLIRERSGEDRRKVLLSLTDRGREIVARHGETRKSLYTGLSPVERETLTAVLERLLQSWTEQGRVGE